MIEIIINKGNMFTGSIEEFSDCFFDVSSYTENEATAIITAWCVEMNFHLKINKKCPICHCNVNKPRKVVVFNGKDAQYEEICFFCEKWSIRIIKKLKERKENV
jgi:hypothetical protein